MMTRSFFALALLTLAACGPVLGLPCKTRADCGASMSCYPTTDGFCSHGCTAEGVDFDCPSGTICTYFGTSNLVCSLPCKVDSDCRSGYECAPVQNSSNLYACRPLGAR